MGSKAQDSYISFASDAIGSIKFCPRQFSQEVLEQVDFLSLKKAPVFEQHQIVGRVLMSAILDKQGECFLLPEVIHFISIVRKTIPTYNFASFEFSLIHEQKYSEEEKEIIRGCIVGKFVPRDNYQNLLPVGNPALQVGPHFSCAHKSPDLDTTVSSYNHFLACFGARLATKRHFWVVPGGAPSALELDFVFKEALGEEVFSVLAHIDKKISISSLDLLTQKKIVYKKLSNLSYNIDSDLQDHSVLLVDEEGCYIGDWREVDIESVRAIIRRFNGMLTENQNRFIVATVSLFAKKNLTESEIIRFIDNVLGKRLADISITREFNEKQRKHLDVFIKDVIGIKEGYGATINDLIDGLNPSFGYKTFREELYKLSKVGKSREEIFSAIEKVFSFETIAFTKFIEYMDSLDVALKIKKKVFSIEEKYLNHVSEYEQVIGEMKNHHHLTVNYAEEGKLYPLGVIPAEVVHRPTVATYSWIDFSNPSEVDARSEIELISVIDHHKSQINTSKPSTIVVLDAQSSNTIMANAAFDLNDRYSTGGMTLELVNQEIEKVQKDLSSQASVRILQRLLQRKTVLMTKNSSFVSIERELLEYIQFLFAILDDTDLLTKVTSFDVDCVASLVNRIKSLQKQKEVEVINFDDLDRTYPKFVSLAATKLIQNHELYSLYGPIHQKKELAISDIIQKTAKGEETNFFYDTKVFANGHVSVTQFKHYQSNAQILKKRTADLQKLWISRCEAMHDETHSLNFFILMLTTVSSAEELFTGKKGEKAYKDELWFYITPESKKALLHLRSFLREFQYSPSIAHQELEIEFYGNAREYEAFLTDILPKRFIRKSTSSSQDIIVLRVDQQSVTSRKKDIATYL